MRLDKINSFSLEEDSSENELDLVGISLKAWMAADEEETVDGDDTVDNGDDNDGGGDSGGTSDDVVDDPPASVSEEDVKKALAAHKDAKRITAGVCKDIIKSVSALKARCNSINELLKGCKNCSNAVNHVNLPYINNKDVERALAFSQKLFSCMVGYDISSKVCGEKVPDLKTVPIHKVDIKKNCVELKSIPKMEDGKLLVFDKEAFSSSLIEGTLKGSKTDLSTYLKIQSFCANLQKALTNVNELKLKNVLTYDLKLDPSTITSQDDVDNIKKRAAAAVMVCSGYRTFMQHTDAYLNAVYKSAKLINKHKD
jgi:hypothetical protein